MSNSFRILRKLLNPRLWLYGSLICAILICGGLAGLRTNQGEDLIRRIIESVVEGAIPTAEFVIGKFQWNGWTEIELHSINLGPQDGVPLIQVGSLQLDLWRISQGNYRGQILLERPVVQVSMNKEGISNLDQLFPPTDSTSETEWPSLPFDLNLYTVEVQSAQLQYLDHMVGLDVDIQVGWKDDQLSMMVHRFDVASDAYGELATSFDVNGDHNLLDIQSTIEHEDVVLTLRSEVESLFDVPRIQSYTTIHIDKGCGVWFNLDDTPMEDVDLKIQANGVLQDLQLSVESSLGMKADVQLDIDTESWNSNLQLVNAAPSNIYPGLETMIMNGEIQIAGTGFSFEDIEQGVVDVHLSDSVVWNEGIEEFHFSSQLHNGQLDNINMDLVHSSGVLLMAGTVDILNSAVDINVETNIHNLSSWSPDWTASLQGVHHITGTWSEPTNIAFQGSTSVQDVHNLDIVNVAEASLQTSGFWDGETTRLGNDISVTRMHAVGVDLSEVTGDLEIALTSEGLDIRGRTGIAHVVVGDGTLELNDLDGGFHLIQDEALFFETQDMSVGQVTLIPAQYVVDGGELKLKLDEEDLRAELHLLRNQRTFIETLAHANIQDGIWQVDELNFSPTGDQPWSLKEGFSFQLTESGVGDMALQLEGDAGLIKVHVDQQNQQPDVMLDVQELDLDYVAQLTNLFVAPDTLPSEISGQAFGTIHLLGTQGQFQEDDFLLLKDVTIPDVVNDIQLSADLSGNLDDVKLQMNLESDTISLLQVNARIPLKDAKPDCDRPVYARMTMPERQLLDIQSIIPILPEIDMVTLLEMTLDGTVCTPSLRMFSQGHTPVGNGRERARWELDLSLEDEILKGQGQIFQAVQSWFSIDIEGSTNISDTINGIEDTAVLESLILSIEIDDLYVQKIGRLFDIPGLGRGPLDGSAVIEVTQEDWNVDGIVSMPKVRLAKHQLTSDSGIEFKLSSKRFDADWQIDFEKKGELMGSVDWDIDSDQLLISSFWTDLPALLLTVGTSDITNGSGRISGSLLVDGTMTEPHINLLAQLQNFGFDLPSMGVRYRNINIEALMEDDLFTIPILSGEASILQNTLVPRWGRFVGSSTMTFDDALSATMELRLSEFPLIHTNSMQATMSGRLEGLQSTKGAQIDGELYVHKGLVRLERDFFEGGASLALPDHLKIHRDVQVQLMEREDDWLDEWMNNLTGNVSVDLGDRIPIHTTMPMTNDYGESLSKLSEVKVDTDIRGVLEVGWLLGEPTILGTISTLRGSFVTMGRAFELGVGEIIFAGSNAYNPQLNLQASKTFGEYGTVNVLVGGTVEEIDMQFEAVKTPYVYDSTDIITLILLGKPSQELAQSESQTAAVLIQTGLTTMGGAVGDAFGGTMVDNVDWDPTEGMFRVGKTLSDTLYLSYMRNYWAEEGENENEITLEWLLLQKVYGEFVTGDANNTHATVYYRWIF